MPQPTLTARIEVFRPGTFKPMAGDPITYSAADLRAIADAYDPETAPAPVVVGHPETDAPAYGWVEGFDYDAEGERLVARVHEIEPAFAELVKAGRYKKVSMAFFSPGQPHNPVPGTWYPKHVGFLGATPPAVSGLRNARFAAPAGAVFTAAFGREGEIASLFRGLRDFLIDRFSLEEAETVLPAWRIDWLDAPEPDPMPRFAAPAATPADTTLQEKDPALTETAPKTSPASADPAFAAREAALADLAERERRVAAREAEARHADHVAFAEKLVTDGRLIAASRDLVVALLDALPGEATVAFAEGAEKVAPEAALRRILEAQPKVVAFGDQDLGADGPASRPAAFAADGKQIDRERLALHDRAAAYQKQHPGTAWLDAVRAVS